MADGFDLGDIDLDLGDGRGCAGYFWTFIIGAGLGSLITYLIIVQPWK